MNRKILSGFFILVAGWWLLVNPACFVFAETTYPQLDISGFKKWEYKRAAVDPSQNYFAGLSRLGGFYPTFTGGPWQERLQLRILGKLSQDLSVSYDLEQQPETPERYDVKVKYYDDELTFGDFTANFSGNEFVSASKNLNGVMLTAKGNWYDVATVPSAKLKSQTQGITSQMGNNTRGPYNLGHGSIVEGSEQIQLNGIPLRRNADYTIDYFEGKITFNRLLSQTDQFKYSYEYTNILDIFFPALSARDFFGFSSRFTIDPEKFGRPAPKKEPVIDSFRDIFPSAGTVEPEIQEEESTGRYRMRNVPAVNFSEVLTFMGVQLKKQEDYLIRYDTGEIKLLTRFLPSSGEVLTVEYKCNQTSLEVETIPGIGSRGPYRVKNLNFVPESEKVELDGKLMVRDLDYKINYNSGEIVFGVMVGPTSQIKVVYRYNVMALPQVIPSKFPKELKIGTTYLKETTRKGAGAPTASAIESYKGDVLIANNYLLYLKNRPVSTAEAPVSLRLKQGTISRELTQEVDFTFPATRIDPATGYVQVTPEAKIGYITDRTDLTDGYATGTLYFYNQNLNISATDEITIIYTYKKNIVGKSSGAGNGSKGPYYINNFRDIVPGTETVQVWTQGSSVITTYTRNSSFDANAGDTGYSFNYSKDIPSITFNRELSPDKNFQIIFQYIPPAAGSGGNISQVAYGLDGSFNIGEVFKIKSAFAGSETDQVYVAEGTVESFPGNGTKSYALHSSRDLVDGSEKIFVNQRLLNKDLDYSISYSKPGQLNFFYVAPATQDVISVEYNFQSLSGVEVGANVKSDTAFRLGAETKIFGDVVTLSGNTKKIGFDFAPLGSTAIGIGSEYEEYNLNLSPPFNSFYTNYSYRFNKNPVGASRNAFLRSYDNSVSMGINPQGRAKVDLSYRNYFTLDDSLSAGAPHNSDSLQESYSGSLQPEEWKRGPLSFNQKYDFRRTVSKNDVIDRGSLLSTTNIDYYHAGGQMKITDRFSAGYDRQNNEPVTLGSLETEVAHSRTSDTSYDFSLDLTTGFIQKWTARVSLLNHDETKITPLPETNSSTRNETYHMDVTPFNILSGSLDHNRQERTSYIAGGGNPKTLKTAGNARLFPFSWFSVGFNASVSESIPESGAINKTNSRSKAVNIDYTPISFGFMRLNTNFAASDSYQIAPLGSLAVRTDTSNFSQNYNLSLNAIPFLPLTFGFTQEDYRNSNNSLTFPVSTETQNQTLTASLSTSPFPGVSVGADYNKKITRDLKTDLSKPKMVVNGKIAYQVLSWGTLTYDLSVERNEGEVQSGSVINLNLKKITQSISLNITIPMNSSVLSNFMVLASFKRVDYKNHLSSSDNFKSELLTFEGTLNF
ncbi:hypothetical protein HZB08_00740 [Candidatus Saganbacteria bacterium]|uniref:Cell surface protein SprA n=1 Tax=Candidatus Saganbacteria bacterium TaxID=2575572 RepID=A0A9D6UJJ5_UNCSA|nr:hypothetical protein [Candidatus Saganbacteria bacterium]